MTTLRFHVPIAPVGKGSFVGFYSPTSKKVVVKNDNPKTKPFQNDVAVVALGAKNRARVSGLHAGPVGLELRFVIARPRGRHDAEAWQCTPDIDKLERSILDALKGVLYVDDRQVIHVEKHKAIEDATTAAGVWIGVELR